MATLIRKDDNRFGEHKFGHHPAVKQTEETIWSTGGLFPWGSTWDTGPTVVTIHSNSADDDEAGIGARIVQVTGLGGDGLQKTETVTMSGTFSVVVGTFSMIYRMTVDDVGDSDTNVGDLSAMYGTWTISTIAATDGQTEMAVYQVPSDMRGYLVNVFASAHGTDMADIALYTREAVGKAWRLRVHFHVTGGREDHHPVPAGFVHLDPGTMLDLRAVGTNASGSEVDGGFDMYFSTHHV